MKKHFFLNNLGLFFSAREKLLNNFKSSLFSPKNIGKILTREPTLELAPAPPSEPTKHKKSKLQLQREYIYKIIADEKDIHDQMFWNYFKYHNYFS